MPQTTILDDPPRALAGQLAEAGAVRYARSYRAEAISTRAIVAGQPVLLGTDPDTQALAITDGDTVDAATFAGILLLETSRALEEAPVTEGDDLSILRMGVVYLQVTDAVTAGDPVFVGNATAQLGDIEGAAGTGLVELPGCRFLTSAASAGFAVAFINPAAAAAATGASSAGEYVPTLTDVTNVAVSALLDARFVKFGDQVTVYFAVTVDATAAAATELGISLPVASALAAANDLTGIAGSAETVGGLGMVAADAANDRAALTYTAVGTGVVTWRGSFSYEIL